MTPAQFNRGALERGELTDEHMVELVRQFQRTHGLVVDGKAGPHTRAALERDMAQPPVELSVLDGWLQGPRVSHVHADPSWFGGPMLAGPLAIVAHYTATAPGTALTMATRRTRPLRSTDRAASWHLTICADGSVIQMLPLTSQAWHVARGVVPIRGGLRPNACAIGIELEGHGQTFPPVQVEAASRVWSAIVREFRIRRELAMIAHEALDPAHRSDPGKVWMVEHARRVLDAAYQ